MVKEYPKGKFVSLSKNFTTQEFECKCRYWDCDVTWIDSDLVDYLQKKRDELDLPIKINSAFRCTKHNKNVGGKPGSIHLQGKAADISIPGHAITKLAEKFEDSDGLGKYSNFLHVDRRGYKARWVG